MRDSFTTIRTEGAILPPDMLRRIADGDVALPGLRPDDYHRAGERLNEVISRSWNRLLGAWASFREAMTSLPPGDAGTSVTRELWLLKLFQELDYGRLQTARLIEVGDRSFAVSHLWGHAPIHLVGCGVSLDGRMAGVRGAARSSPHSLLQELLNAADEYAWGFVSNGLLLRVLRDNASLTRQAFVEFDLEAMFDGQVYPDFILLWLVCHQSRVEGQQPPQFWLERWSRIAQEQGARALEHLRDGVQRAIECLGRGFLAHPTNSRLRQQLQAGALSNQGYYRQVLRLVYRLLFLFVAEDRGLLLDPEASESARERYTRFYAIDRLRRLAERRAGTRHHDLYLGLQVVLRHLGGEGCPALGLPALGSFLFSQRLDVDDCLLANNDLLTAIRALAFLVDRHGRRPVDYRNLGPEELGSVYESLLELHPELTTEADGTTFTLKAVSGNERKRSGSYYTPEELITSLLDSALEPVIQARLAAAREQSSGGTAAPALSAESALLSLKICDPACGGGSFLIAAAHRLARRLATIRSGELEPPPAAVRAALRDVIGRCIYGVDINPMAVELCKVSLWMEALEPGKPLSFLDHHIQSGNSLLGATPALLRQGIPNAAFEPIEGDDKAYCREFKRRNKEERTGQTSFVHLLAPPWERLGDLSLCAASVDDMPDGTIAEVRRREEQYEACVRSQSYRFGKLLADSWCAAFVWQKRPVWDYPITEELFRKIERNPSDIHPDWQAEVMRLAEQYQFFHWHIAFPDVFRLPTRKELHDDNQPVPGEPGWNGGFDVVLGNPPWERIKLQEQEWFATWRPEIANAPNAAERRRMIEALREATPALYAAFLEDRRKAEGESHFVRNSGRFPLCGRGDVNTYSIFAETKRMLINGTGRVGVIVPSGIATDDTTKLFFRDLVETGALVSLYDFENAKGIFPGVHRSYKFCLLTLAGAKQSSQRGAEFVFFAHQPADLRDPQRRIKLSANDIGLINPNTHTCPIFRSSRDAELTKAIYRRVPVLINEQLSNNSWNLRFLTMFHMANDSRLFQNTPADELLPLYEAKLLHQFSHRWATYQYGSARDCTPAELADPHFAPSPRYWVPRAEVEARLAGRWQRDWLLGWRDICRSTDERTAIFSLLPRVGVGHKAPLVLFQDEIDPAQIACFLANVNSFVFDYVTRQKMGGTSLSYFILNQLPVLPPECYTTGLLEQIVPRVLELVYTAWDMRAFAAECGYNGPPFRWDEERRFQLRCELDALYFQLYGIQRDDVAYMMDTFPIVKRKDEARHGVYRTKLAILACYDGLAAGVPAQVLVPTIDTGPGV